MPAAPDPAPPKSPPEGTHPPGPKGIPLLGVLPQIGKDPLGFFTRVAREHGGLTRFGNRKFTLYLLSDPAGIREVLTADAKNYWKGEGIAAARTVMGKGLATSTGTVWQRQRRLMQPSFSPSRVQAMAPVLAKATQGFVEVLAAASEGEDPIDVLPAASNMVQEILFRGLFSHDCDHIDTRALGHAMAVANDHIHKSAWTMVPLPAWVPTPHRRRFAKAMQLLDETVYGLIRDRRARGSEDPDLLGRMLAVRDEETGEGMTDQQLRDEVMTLFVAGHDTSAAAIAWGLSLFAENPQVQDQVVAEVAGSGSTDGAALAGLDYTGRFVQETLRIYPPGWILVRTPYKDVTLCGYHVPKDAPILISPWVVHRDPELWPEPERCDPDRFLPERMGKRPRFAWFPYGGGARTCIGLPLADLLLRGAFAMAAPRFRFDLVPGKPPTPQPKTTLQPKGGLWLRVRTA